MTTPVATFGKLISITLVLWCTHTKCQDRWLIGGNNPNNPAVFGLGSQSTDHIRMHTMGLERMRILNIGRVGIGTPNPDYNLTLHGQAPPPAGHGEQNPYNPGSASVFQITNTESGQGLLAGLQVGLIGYNAFIRTLDKVRLRIQNQDADIHLHANGRISFFSHVLPPNAPKMVLHSQGHDGLLINNVNHSQGYSLKIDVSQPNVNALAITNGSNFPVLISGNGFMSLGTNEISPDFRFDVGGKIRACEVRVMNPGWCDYVFAPNYNLMPLEDLKSFIVQNRHLPEVPSESEVEADGFDLAAMNATLLKKIEELTLYVIELNDIVNSLQGNVKTD